jgi:hypothetical protein
MLVSNATISLASPPVANKPIQDTIIRIKIADTWVAKNFWWPELGSNYNGSALIWFLGAIVAGYGKLSGKILVEYYYVDVLIKVKPFHDIKIQALPPDKLSPNQITTIPVLVENQGNYNDTFNFRIKTETGYPLHLTNNSTITLQPGEQGQALVGVAAPPNALDTGTLHSIILEAYSAQEPNTTIASQRIFLETQGFYFSEQNTTFLATFGFFVLLVIFLFIYWRRKVYEKISIPPEKPWKIPEEQQHLAELKRTDITKYEQDRTMMEAEYKSALLWYDDYRKTVRMKPEKGKIIKTISAVFTKSEKPLKVAEKPEKKQKEKLTKSLLVIFKKSEKPPKVKEKRVTPIFPAEDKIKEKLLAKIKSEQDRQIKKQQVK